MNLFYFIIIYNDSLLLSYSFLLFLYFFSIPTFLHFLNFFITVIEKDSWDEVKAPGDV